ncbi:hypothetical protein ACXGQW_01705 [Wenyingzhuangia sp. IMCC45533]
MQKTSFIILLLVSSLNYACDVCSCGSSNASSFSGNFSGNFIGFAYNYLYFTFLENTLIDDTPIADDHINTINISGQYYITPRVLLSAVIPYRFNTRNTSFDNVSNDGLGDITVRSLISILNLESNHTLKLGVGLKLPTGSFNLQRARVNQTSATQLGTGSLDVILPLEYSVRLKDFTVNLNGNYFIKNKNNEEFKYGNQTQITSNVSYKIEVNQKTSISPSLGFSYDHFLPTSRFDIENKGTSGYMANTNFGMELNVKQFIFGANYQLPIAQNLIDKEVRFESGFGIYTYWTF